MPAGSPAPDAAPRPLATRPRRVLALLLAVTALLLILHVIGMILFYEHPVGDETWFALTVTIFDLDDESSLGTWWSAMLLFVAAALLHRVASDTRARGARDAGWWTALGVGFLILSIDEVAGFHELLNTLLEDKHWTHYGALVAGACCLAFLPFVRRLPGRTGALFMIAGLIYVGGAVGVEWWTLDFEREGRLGTLAYDLWNTLEEGMEMIGVSVFLYALLAMRAR